VDLGRFPERACTYPFGSAIVRDYLFFQQNPLISSRKAAVTFRAACIEGFYTADDMTIANGPFTVFLCRHYSLLSQSADSPATPPLLRGDLHCLCIRRLGMPTHTSVLTNYG